MVTMRRLRSSSHVQGSSFSGSCCVPACAPTPCDPSGPVDPGVQLIVVANPSANGRRSAHLRGSWCKLREDRSPEATARMIATELETHAREHRPETRFGIPSDGLVLIADLAWIDTEVGRLLQEDLLCAVVFHEGVAVGKT